MAYERRTFTGGAVATTITGAINASDTSITLAATTGWPTGSAGDFGVVINRGEADEEKVLIDTRSGSTLTVATSGRGVDGTSAQSHSAGATIELTLFARDLDEPNAHIADTGLDHHTQYHNNTRGDARYPLKSNNLSDVTAATARTNLGLGTIATQGAGAVAITGGTIAGITDLAVADGGTGASDAAGARTNLGLGTAATIDTGTGAGNAILGNDARLTDTRTPTDASVTQAKFDTALTRAFTVANAAARTALANLREGDTCWQQDTDLRFYYTGAAWRYVPGQKLASAQVTADQTGLGTGSDLTGLAATFNALGGPVKVFGKCRILGQTSASLAILRLQEGGTQLDDIARSLPIGVADSAILVGWSAILTPSSASHTYKLVYGGTAGSPTMKASSDEIATIEVWSA